MRHKPSVIFFDLDETLVENNLPAATLFAKLYRQFSDSLGTDNQEAFFNALRARATNLWSSMFDSSTPPEKQFIQCFASSIAEITNFDRINIETLANDMFDQFVAMSSSNVNLNEGALKTLNELSNQGISTGIITNGMEQVQLGKIHSIGLHANVDHIVVSAQARAHKPSKAVFELALSKAVVSAKQAWQIGDHATNDVAGSIRAGMSGLFYNPSGQPVESAFKDIKERPTYTITRLSDVLELLES